MDAALCTLLKSTNGWRLVSGLVVYLARARPPECPCLALPEQYAVQRWPEFAKVSATVPVVYWISSLSTQSGPGVSTFCSDFIAYSTLVAVTEC